jgi:hypothetical protein
MKTKPPPSTSRATTAERLDAMEYLLGQALLALEADSAAQRDKAARLEAAISRLAPDALAPPSEEEQGDIPFTLDSLGAWVQICLRAAREHQAMTARQMVAIGELTDRVLALGSTLAPEPPLPIGPAARLALATATRRPAAG